MSDTRAEEPAKAVEDGRDRDHGAAGHCKDLSQGLGVAKNVRIGHKRLIIFLRKGRELGDEAKASGHIQEQHAPEHPPLGVFTASPKVKESAADTEEADGVKSRRQPACGWILEKLGSPDYQDKEDHAPDVEGLGYAGGGQAAFVCNDHGRCDLAHEEGAKAEAHDGKPCHKTTLVREPADQGGNGRDITESVPKAADDAICEVEKRKAGHLISQTGKEGTGSEENAAYGSDKPRAFLVHQGPAECSGRTDHEHEDHEGELCLGFTPTMHANQGLLEDRPA